MTFPYYQMVSWKVRCIANGVARHSVVTFGICVVGIILYFNWLRPIDQRIALLRNDANAIPAKSIQELQSKKDSAPDTQLATFYRFFPSQGAALDAITQLNTTAVSQNLSLDQGDYHLVHDRDTKLTRYNIVLPVKGGYVQIQKFIAQALTDIPNLSLDSITFNRQKVDDTSVEAQLNFTLYLGGE